MKSWVYLKESNFNTSHVNVNRRTIYALFACCGYFNTSHVNVNPSSGVNDGVVLLYFNTSHVNVDLVTPRISSKVSFISIHLMLMLIQKEFAYTLDDIDFNTSHVNVNHNINPRRLITQ